MQKREAAFQVKFNRWLKYVYLKQFEGPTASVFELKHDRGRGYIPYSEVQEHQLVALSAARTEGIAYKIPDDSRSYKPFDCIALAKVNAYVVPCYGNRFYLIDVSRWVDEDRDSERRSCTEERAKEIANLWGVIGDTNLYFKKTN